jgi:ABC-type Mn2+/Zn2+ transport system permease subunit
MLEFFYSLHDFIEFDFLSLGLIATILLSIGAGLLSPLIIARNYAFIGSAISHSTLLGVAISLGLLNLTMALPIFFSTLTITLVLTLFLAWATYHQKLPSDALIGIFFTTTMGLGVIIHQLYAGSQANILSYLFGNILLLDQYDFWILLALVIIILSTIIIPFKQWVYTTFDQLGAEISGVNTKMYHYAFFLLLTVLIIASIKVAGTVLINTLLLVPGFVALKISKDIKKVFIISISFSICASFIGLVLANFMNLPSGATLSIAQFFLMISILGLKKLNR